MNSNKLKKEFPEVYKTFFTDNEIILSAPFVMNRSWDVMPNYNWIFIKQKLPIRMYIWVKFNKSRKIEINRLKYLDTWENRFRNINAFEHAPYFFDLSNILSKKYKKLITKYWWIEITILSEISRWYWLWFGPIAFLLISTLIKRLENKECNQEKIEKINQLDISEVINNSYVWFKDIFEESLLIDKEIYWMFFGSTQLTSFFNWYYPIVSFTEDIDERSVRDISQVKYYSFRLNELFPNLRWVPYMPIDYGIIYSGNPVILEQVTGKKSIQKEFNEKVRTEIDKIFSEHLSDIVPNKSPLFYKNFIKENSHSMQDINLRYTWKISTEILYFMSLLYSKNYYEDYIKRFVYNLRNQRYLDYINNDSSSYFRSVVDALTNNFELWSKKFLWLFPNDSSVMWWCINFATPLEWFRSDTLQAIKETSNKFTWLKLIYANWIDWLEHDWLRFEQDFENNLYSEFLDGSNYILRYLDGKTKIWELEELVEDENNDLLLDTINNKIYLRGKKLTSKELHSQTTTVDILRILLNNINKDIPNKSLPQSSYSKNKNEMLGKIVLPLISLLEKVTGEKLQFICKWSIYDFYLKLKTPKMTISILEKF